MFNIFDIICIIICFIYGVIGYKRGAIKTLISFGGFIASFIIAWIFAPQLGEWVKSLVFFQRFIENLNIKEISESLMSGGFQNAVATFPELNQFLGSTGNVLSQGVEFIFQNLINGIAVTIAFGIIVIMVNLVVAMIQGMFSLVNRIPIIGGINKIIGFCFGLILGGSGIFVITGILIGINLLTLGQTQFSFLESSEIVRLMTPWIAKILVL